MASRKIFDIIPPGEVKKLTPSPQPEKKTAFLKRLTPVEKPVSKKPSSFFKKKPLFVGGFIAGGIFLICALCFFLIRPKAEIEIWPQKESVAFKTQITVDSSKKTLEGNVLPGEILRGERSVFQEFPSTGTKIKSEKAQGVIRVYNTYSADSLVLIAKTRFVSDDGKLFRTPERVVVPGGHFEKGKLIPGEIDVEVVADQAGPEYNIGPSTFSIPGLAGTARYTAFYGKSFAPMTGGYKTGVPQVIQEDLDRAKEILSARALKESKTSLEDLISSADFFVIEGTLAQEVLEILPLAEKGQEIEAFLFQIKARTEALVFKKSLLRDFAKAHVLSLIPQGKELQEGSLEVNYLPRSIDLEGKKATLEVEISARIYPTINKETLKEMAAGKKPAEVGEILSGLSEIERAQMRLWPFWAARAPRELERTDIKLRVD